MRVGTSKIVDLALAGHTPAPVNDAMAAAIASKELLLADSGASEGYDGDSIPHGPSHLMFFDS